MARSDIPPSDLEPEVPAAGGVLIRRNDGGEPELAVIHRPKYMDWSLPKGKLDPGEDWLQAALREVEEETGYRCEAGEELSSVGYRDRKGRRKLVRYWLMEPLDGRFEPHDEVDELRWLSPEEADRQLSYEHDRALVREALG
jgi:8-oxo-dGTP diphosphatase